jgi:hypothetical protein
MGASVTILQSLTLVGWSKFLYNLMDAGNPWLGLIFYYLIVLLGAYFILNLILALILSNFLHFQKEQ